MPAVKRTKKPIKAKVVVVGSTGVGKTSIILRHDNQGFTSRISPTLGLEGKRQICASYVSSTTNQQGKEIELQIWDTAGQERFRSMVPMYLRNAVAAILVYDITSRNSFQDLNSWIEELEKGSTQPLALFVMANKCDLIKFRSVTEQEGQEFAARNQSEYFETSALSGKGIENAMITIAQTLASRVGKPPEEDFLRLHESRQIDPEETKKSNWCCNIL